jgi:hypothetical protein
MKMVLCLPMCAALVSTAAPAMAQSNVTALHKFSWSENGGWMNWRDAGDPLGAQGVRLHGSFLSGSAWGENIGFISFGDGTPANATSYANTTGADFGVNVSLNTGALTGFAWGENAGWINFSGGALATPPNPARYDVAAGRLRGFAWGENIGWINLDDGLSFVGFTPCPSDFNRDGVISSQDFFDFLGAFFTASPTADVNHDEVVNSQDFFDFLTAFFAGC